MMRRAAAAASSSYCNDRGRGGGMPRLHSSLVFFNNFFHSQASVPSTIRKPPKLTNLGVGDGLSLFNAMLQMRPLPCVVRFNQIMGHIAKLKHYQAVISLYTQMDRLRVVPDAYTLNIIINCFCHLNQMGFSLSVLGKFFKFGIQPNISQPSTLLSRAFFLWRKFLRQHYFSAQWWSKVVSRMMLLSEH
ncbi:hypothetical protein ABKV19_000265 [Rosa sericea]